CPPDRGAAGLALVAADLVEPLEQPGDLVRLFGEMGLALLRDLEGLARAFALRLLDQAHVLQHGEGRIDYAGARRIGAVGQLLDRADQIVAVARLIGDELQEDEPKLAGIEHPPAAAAAAAATAAAPFVSTPLATAAAET